MKSKMRHHVQPRESVQARNEEAQREIQGFLQAVDSYPARVAKEPRVSFQQHLSSVFGSTSTVPRRRD